MSNQFKSKSSQATENKTHGQAFIADDDLGEVGVAKEAPTATIAAAVGMTTDRPTLDIIGNNLLAKAGLAPVQWQRYYQPVENSTWLAAPEADTAPLFGRIKPALTMTCATNFVEHEDDTCTDRKDTYYLSDEVWFDIDCDTPDEAINAAHRFVRKLEETGLDLRCLRLYASGKKGFHVFIPLSAFVDDWWENLTAAEMRWFPNICKEVAQALFVEGLDMGVYSARKGRQLREADVKRDIGTYKVALTLAEFWIITPKLYAEFVSSPRGEVGTVPTEVNYTLGSYWDAAAAKVEVSEEARANAVSAPVTDEKIERVKSVLEYLHPDDEADGYEKHHLRLQVVQAVHFELGREVGLPIIREWAKHSVNPKFAGAEWRQMFNSSSAKSGRVTSFGSLFTRATPKGWVDPYPELNPNHNPAINEDAKPVHNTELGMAEYIVRKYADKLLYVMDLELWYFWDGKKWERDDDSFSLNRALKKEGRELRNRLGAPLHAVLTEAIEQDDKAAIKDAGAAVKSHNGYYNKLESATAIEAVKKLMKAEVRRVTHQALDADPFLLNVQNGVLDLKTGELLPHSPDYFMTKITAVDYNHSAPCPQFLSFMDGIAQGRQDLTDFMQEALGYSLSGDMTIQLSYWEVGGGANGKSTLNNSIKAVLGSYALTMPIETFLVSRRQMGTSPDPQMMNMPGARFVCTTEMAKGSQLDEATFKNLVSTDDIPARNLYAKKIAAIRPTFKLWPAFNDLPLIASTESAIGRRICTLPFDADFENQDKAKRILGLEGLLKKEQEGILAWCVDGFQRVWKRAVSADAHAPRLELTQPVCCLALKGEYLGSLDIVHNFVKECLVQDEQGLDRAAEGVIPAALLFDGYMYFCQRNNLPKISNTRFGRDIAKHLPDKVRNKRGMTYIGWKIADVWVNQDMREREGNRDDILGKAIFVTD